jgi:hypothetical protein
VAEDAYKADVSKPLAAAAQSPEATVGPPEAPDQASTATADAGSLDTARVHEPAPLEAESRTQEATEACEVDSAPQPSHPAPEEPAEAGPQLAPTLSGRQGSDRLVLGQANGDRRESAPGAQLVEAETSEPAVPLQRPEPAPVMRTCAFTEADLALPSSSVGASTSSDDEDELDAM